MVIPEVIVPVAAWIALGMGGLFMAWLAPKAFGFLAEAVADKTVEKLEGRLAPMWQADLEDALEPIYKDLKSSEPNGEKWPNGSDNLPDSMREIYRRVDEIQRWVVGPPPNSEWDDIEGTPI